MPSTVFGPKTRHMREGMVSDRDGNALHPGDSARLYAYPGEEPLLVTVRTDEFAERHVVEVGPAGEPGAPLDRDDLVTIRGIDPVSSIKEGPDSWLDLDPNYLVVPDSLLMRGA